MGASKFNQYICQQIIKFNKAYRNLIWDFKYLLFVKYIQTTNFIIKPGDNFLKRWIFSLIIDVQEFS